MNISEVLSIHGFYQTEAPVGLPIHTDILGDAFLMQNNSVYRNIKTEALRLGCNYKEAWPEYLLMPFHQLGQIVSSKTIPYVPSRRLLQSVEDKRANVLSIDDMQIPESYHLHEAAHIIADSYFVGSELKDPQEKILKAIVCESFANTVDALSRIDVEDDLHEFFLKQNNYMHPNKSFTSALSRLVRSPGSKFTFVFTLVAYMHANFLKENTPLRIVKELGNRYAKDTALTDKHLKNCEVIQKMVQQLDPQFRMLTTKMYLNLEGYDGDVFSILNFPFMQVFDGNPVFAQAIEAMAEIVLKKTPSEAPGTV